MVRTTAIDDDLPDWETLTRYEWPTLLLGNGMSINLWRRFAYDSLFNKSTLSSEAQKIFAEMDTTNFETALECVQHARIVLDALGRGTERVDELYAEVRDALFGAVTDAHVRWNSIPFDVHKEIAGTLDGHDAVFTTNYDLCIYWAQLVCRDSVRLVDYFWGARGGFDPEDVEIWSANATPIHYLHGAVHLWQHDDDNGKWTSAEGGNLLALARNYTAASQRRPLFVSEGTSKAKLRSIRRSPYLRFCLERLSAAESNIVIFGHSLSPHQDQHIIDALNAGIRRKIAVSVYPVGDPQEIIGQKVRIRQALDQHEVHFYGSTTHPLGAPALCIPPTS